MTVERSQIKFAKSGETGEVIGFVSRLSKSNKLIGVREDYKFGKKICVLSENLKGTIVPNALYTVELKPMHNGNGFVVVSATPVLFKAAVETITVSKSIYQVVITFGNKTVYFDPKDGKSASSMTVDGVVKLLSERRDIDNRDEVIADFRRQAKALLRRMDADGYIVPKIK